MQWFSNKVPIEDFVNISSSLIYYQWPMYTSSISSYQAFQDVDPTVAESQGQPLPEGNKTTHLQ